MAERGPRCEDEYSRDSKSRLFVPIEYTYEKHALHVYLTICLVGSLFIYKLAMWYVWRYLEIPLICTVMTMLAGGNGICKYSDG